MWPINYEKKDTASGLTRLSLYSPGHINNYALTLMDMYKLWHVQIFPLPAEVRNAVKPLLSF